VCAGAGTRLDACSHGSVGSADTGATSVVMVMVMVVVVVVV
jgi:hypothetical protein